MKDLIVRQRGIGPAAEMAAGLIEAAAPGSRATRPQRRARPIRRATDGEAPG